MPGRKPPGAPGGAGAKATYGGASSSASGQIFGGKAYPPSLPPVPPKAKATPPQQFYIGDSEEDFNAAVGPLGLISKAIYKGMDTASNAFNPSTPPMYGYQNPTPPSWNKQLELHREQQRQMKEKQQRLFVQKSSGSASMVQQHLSNVSQQQQVFTPPRREGKGRGINTPESQ